MDLPVVVMSKADIPRLAKKSPNAAAAAMEFFKDPPPGMALVVSWSGSGRRRKYTITRAVTAIQFATQ